jgi:hypothetical protein
MNKELRKACTAYLLHAKENGIRRIYETLPEWMKHNHPVLYKKIPEFVKLESVPGKNDIAYRAMSEQEKDVVRSKRKALWEGIAKRVVKPVKCKGCDSLVTPKWGGRNPVSLEHAIDQRHEYCSTACAFSSSERTAKIKTTNMARYGTVCSLNSKQSIKKKKATWLKNHGVSNPSQAPEVLERIQAARYGRKQITLNGRQFLYQGYEAVVLKKLARANKLKTFTSKASEIGTFDYYLAGKLHKYLPDIKATSKSGAVMYIEVKSVATLNPTKAIGRKVKAKAKAMWETHGLSYMVALCSHNEILGKARSYQELVQLMKKHRLWSRV